jgi:farnesyl diphosphate synthase
MSEALPAQSLAIDASMRSTAAEVDALFGAILADPPDPRRRLYEAMRYAAVGGGKRLRPLLVVASASRWRSRY